MQSHDLAETIIANLQELRALMRSYQRLTAKRDILLDGADVLASRLVTDITALRQQHEAEQRERG